jgi:glucokinase
MTPAIGIDIGGTRVKAVRLDEHGQARDHHERETRDDAEALTQTVREMVKALTAASEQRSESPAVGLAAPGLTRPGEAMIHWMSGRMESLVGLDWSKALGCAVTVLNDGHAAVLGEAALGAARGCEHVVLLTLGTGVGGGVMVDGRLLSGHIGRAGHLGHISLDPTGPTDIVATPGSLEDAVSDHTLAARTEGRFTNTQALAEAVAAGDRDAQAHWQHMIQSLAAGLVSLVNAFDPQVLVIGGGIAQAGAHLLEPLEAQFRQWEWQPAGHQVTLTLAELGPWSGAMGAARAAGDERSQRSNT